MRALLYIVLLLLYVLAAQADLTGTLTGGGGSSVNVTNNPLNVSIAAGGSAVNVTQFGGSNLATGTGVGGAGIPRVTVSSDSFPASQAVTLSGNVTTIPASGSTWPVSGTFFQSTQPVSISAGGSAINVTQFGGQNVLTGAGIGGAGIPRVTVSSDSSLAANQSVNISQMNGITTSMNNGTVDTGTQRVAIAAGASAINLTTINGVTLLAGNGASGTGSPRVTIANNQTAFPVTVTGTVTNSQTDGSFATYSGASTAVLSAASATDIACIAGSATKAIRVTRIGISATQTTAGEIDAILLVRSTVDSGASSVTPKIAHDSTDVASTAALYTFAANPTQGTLLGNVRVVKLYAPAAATANVPGFFEFKFGDGIEKAVTLRGTTQALCVNLNGVTVTGGNFDLYFEWQEQ